MVTLFIKVWHSSTHETTHQADFTELSEVGGAIEDEVETALANLDDKLQSKWLEAYQYNNGNSDAGTISVVLDLHRDSELNETLETGKPLAYVIEELETLANYAAKSWVEYQIAPETV